MRLRVLLIVVAVLLVAVVVAAVLLTSGDSEPAEVEAEVVEEPAEVAEDEEDEEEPAEVAEDVEPDAAPEPVEEEPSPCGNGIVVPNSERYRSLMADCEALLASRDALAGDATLNWGPGTRIRGWDGVTIDWDSNRVTRLDLEGIGLTGRIPAELGRLTALDILSLEDNNLSGAIPAALGALEKLRYLLLENNQLSGSIPGELGALHGLWRLKLGGNQLTGPIPPELASMVSLGTLELHDNQLSGAVPWELENLRYLHRLTLAGNTGLTGCLPPTLRAPTGIIRPGGPPLHVDLPNCPPRIPPAELCRDGVIVTNPEDQPDLVRDCTILLVAKDALAGDATLNWDADTPIAAWDGIRLGGVPLRVHAIDLASRGLTGHIPSRLGFLPALVALRLNDNDLTGAIPGGLAFLPSLESLTVQGNPGLTGCIPLALRDVRDNDLARLGFSECAPSPCENGTVVASPADNAGLVRDCTALLLGRAALADDARLNWDAATPITEWEGVTVGGTPLRVHGLALKSRGLTGRIPPELGALSELRNLSLAGGPFERGQLTGPIPATLGSLRKLEVLDLRYNGLTGAIPSTLGTLENLQNLSLASNLLSGTVPAALAGLGNLRRLSLGGNRLSGAIPEALGALRNLMFLDLSDNLLTGTIPAALGELRQLQDLSLGGNLLTGAIPREFGALENLLSLSFASNQLTGSIPGELKSLRRLDFLSLGGNFSVTGCIPPVLRHLYPPANDAIHIYLPTCTPAHICEDGLVVANPGDNPGLVGDCAALLMVETELAGDASPYPWHATLNWDAGTPITEWEGVTVSGTPARVRALDLESRELTGQIQPQLSRLSALEELRLGGNSLSGFIPAALGQLATLERLSLSGNADLTGCVPPALREVQDHDFADLGLPDCPAPVPPAEACRNGTAVPRPADNPGLVQDCVALLTAEAALAGSAILNWDPDIPITQWEGVSIGGTPERVQALELSGRGLTGQIPPELGDLVALRSLDLSRNNLADAIPAELGALANLEHLALGGNRLTSTIPVELGALRKLVSLSLSGNHLSGSIPAQLGALRELEDLSLAGNRLTGSIPVELGSLANLEVLLLGYNHLSGQIPAALGQLSNLEVLRLNHNQLRGEVPMELEALHKLRSLQLVGNYLTGPLPDNLWDAMDIMAA